jgi:hypothetical protein
MTATRTDRRPLLCAVALASTLGCADHVSSIGASLPGEVQFADRYVEIGPIELIPLDSVPLGSVTSAVWMADTLVLADSYNESIRLFGPDGNEVLRLGRRGDGPGELRGPTAVVVDSSGVIWTGDERGRLLRRTVEGDGLETVAHVSPTIRSLVFVPKEGLLLVAGMTRSRDGMYAASLVDKMGTVQRHLIGVQPPPENNRFNLQAFFAAGSGGHVVVWDRSVDSVVSWIPELDSIRSIAIPPSGGFEAISWPETPIGSGEALADFMRHQWVGHTILALGESRFLLSIVRSRPDRRRLYFLFDAGEKAFAVLAGAPDIPLRAARSDTLYWVGVDPENGRGLARRFAPKPSSR